MKRLADLAADTGLPVDMHLVLDLVIPIHHAIQAQGDLLVIPLAMVADRVAAREDATWDEVPPGGAELLRGGAGGNAHTLVADPGTCIWTAHVTDVDGLALAILDAMAPVYLLHREHGGTGIAAGTYVIRRQRELEPPSPPVRRFDIVPPRAIPRAMQPESPPRPRIRYVAD